MKGIFRLSLLLILLSIPCFGFKGVCVAVSDGDTIKVKSEEAIYIIRLYGIDAPEKKQAYGKESTIALTKLIKDYKVDVNKQSTDKYKRIVAIVKRGNTNVNYYMVKYGHAWWYKTYAPKHTYLKSLQEKAKKNKLGLWASESPTPPWEYRRKK